MGTGQLISNCTIPIQKIFSSLLVPFETRCINQKASLQIDCKHNIVFRCINRCYMKKTRLCKAVVPTLPPLALSMVCQIIAGSGRGRGFMRNRKGELFYRGNPSRQHETNNLVKHHCTRILEQLGQTYTLYIAENNLSLPDPITIKEIE